MNKVPNDQIYKRIDEEFKRIVKKYKLQNEKVDCSIIAKGFTGRRPKSKGSSDFLEQHMRMPSKEYALAGGNEVIVRCKFKNSHGDAFTDQPRAFKGELKQVLGLLFGDPGSKAIYFATLNATLCHLGMVEGTVHCDEDEPKKCGVRLADYILKNFDDSKIAHIGYQPGHVEACSKRFLSYVTDLNPENIGKTKFDRKIISGLKNEEVLKKVRVACITGSTLTNGSLPDLIKWCEASGTNPLIYGVSGVGAAKILGLNHFCPYGRNKP